MFRITPDDRYNMFTDLLDKAQYQKGPAARRKFIINSAIKEANDIHKMSRGMCNKSDFIGEIEILEDDLNRVDSRDMFDAAVMRYAKITNRFLDFEEEEPQRYESRSRGREETYSEEDLSDSISDSISEDSGTISGEGDSFESNSFENENSVSGSSESYSE